MLQPRHKRDMPDRTGRRQCIEQIANHGPIDLDVFRLGLLPQPRSDEDIGGTQASQDGTKGFQIQQVPGQGNHAVNVGGRPPRQSMHLPASFAQMPGEVIADDTAGSNHKRRTCHVLSF
jgi:hypothetical protein